MALLKKDNRLVASVPFNNLRHWLKEQGHTEADYEISLEPKEKTALVRTQINKNAGDPQSLLGTTADTSQLLLYYFSQLVDKLHGAESFSDVQEATAPFAALAKAFLAKIESGEVKLPFMTKGVDKVISDIEQRATSVTQVLEARKAKPQAEAKKTVPAEKTLPVKQLQKQETQTEIAKEKTQNTPEEQVVPVRAAEAVNDHNIDTEVIQKIIAEQFQQFLQKQVSQQVK